MCRIFPMAWFWPLITPFMKNFACGGLTIFKAKTFWELSNHPLIQKISPPPSGKETAPPSEIFDLVHLVVILYTRTLHHSLEAAASLWNFVLLVQELYSLKNVIHCVRQTCVRVMMSVNVILLLQGIHLKKVTKHTFLTIARFKFQFDTQQHGDSFFVDK